MGDGLPVDLASDEAKQAFYDALLDDDPSALYERAPCGYLSTLPDGTISKANQTFLALTGYGRDELVGRRSFAQLLTAGGRIYHETHYAPMLQMQGTVREIALDIVRADGTRLPVLVNSVLERDENGTPLVVRTAVFDATHRREYERELLRAKERAEVLEARATMLARTLQQTLIPPTPPEVPGLDVGAAYRPAGNGEEVGGDFYDVFQIADGDWAVAIGDVCGKGVGAAVVTAQARHTIRAGAVLRPQPCAILDTLNEVLLHHAADRFCTVALLRLRLVGGSWRATVCCAGHPPPLLVRPGEEPVAFGGFGSLLGVLRVVNLEDAEVVLQSGDSLVLYTDGVTEARDGPDFFGDERLSAAVARLRCPANDVATGLLDEVMAFQRGDPSDDIAIVAICVP
ncbi:MAG: SpoIIE family protein phosphatase [Actinomycetota bacterium]|nr:SpoIIE family protein phosphatase [Acidimicrobiia bacterium]MDQ3294128.1 SpoIIE family protein phosphatase [Actinomycetota bacterium]